MKEYTWSFPSAVYQVARGELDHERTRSARDWLRASSEPVNALTDALLDSRRELAQAGQPQADKIRQWTITVDYVPGQGWEAAAESGGDYWDGGWESTDPITLMAAVGRDLAAEVNGASNEHERGERAD